MPLRDRSPAARATISFLTLIFASGKADAQQIWNDARSTALVERATERRASQIADTALGAIWKLATGADSKADQPALMTQSVLLEGADGPAFDPLGNLWVAANERNAVVLVQPDGKVFDVHKNDSKGPLEFPTSVVFVDATAYVSNFDTPRRDNLAADGKTSLDGIGASIIKIEQ